MGDVGDVFNNLRNKKRQMRAKWGLNCVGCPKVQPKRTPTILVPGQRCKVCGYTDPREVPDEVKHWRGRPL